MHFFHFRPVPKTRLLRINYLHNTNKKVLQFLETQGAYVPHGRPKYLLKYEHYCVYETKLRKEISYTSTTNVMLDKETFYLRSKQAWLDVLLQTMKILVLPRIAKPITALSISFAETFLKITHILKADLDPEIKLQKWLTEIYHNNRNILLKIGYEKDIDNLYSKKIRNFHSDLSDGLVIICLLLTYCPYLENFLRHIYLKVDCYEKAFSNAAKLIKALKMLKMSFDISPSDIVKPCSIQMLMFICYCYEVLPCMYPQSTIRFETSLNRTASEVITLKNITNFKVIYTTIFLYNDLNCFSTSTTDVFRIPPYKTEKIKVKYLAKKITTTKCILIFCGEITGEVYAKSHVFVLEGLSDFEKPFSSLTFNIPIYSSQTFSLKINSPYVHETEYTYKISYEQPRSDTSEMREYISFIGGIKLKLAVIEQSSLRCRRNGIGVLDITLASFTLAKNELWILFYNKEFGDFFIKINIISTCLDYFEREDLHVLVPENWDSIKCTCKGKFSNGYILDDSECGKILKFSIPRRNGLLYKNIYNLFLRSITNEYEREAWKFHLGTSSFVIFNFVNGRQVQEKLRISARNCIDSL